MKKLLTITAITVCLFASTGQAQTKHKLVRFYKIQVEFKTTDGCYRTATCYHYDDSDQGFQSLKAQIKRWVKPYKMIDSSFAILGIRISSKSEFDGHPKAKYEPCKQIGLSSANLTSTSLSLIDTSIRLNSIYWAQPSYNFITVFQGRYQHILTVSPPDSSKTVTVTFSKSLVHFLNDSTFTYKQ